MITEREQKLIREVLNMVDYQMVARETNYSFPTINNIVNRITALNDKNVVCFIALLQRAVSKLKKQQKYQDELQKSLNQIK